MSSLRDKWADSRVATLLVMMDVRLWEAVLLLIIGIPMVIIMGIAYPFRLLIERIKQW